MKAELVPQDGDPPIPITKDVTVIGRRAGCDVVIEEPSLSKQHCVLVRTDGLLMVRDLATTNGTKVNGQRISWAALLPNDRLTIGRVKFRVYLGSDEQPSPSETRAKQHGVRWAPPAAAGSVIQLKPEDVAFPLPTPSEGTPRVPGPEVAASPAAAAPVDPPPQAPPDLPAQAPGDSDDEIFLIDLDL